MDKIICAEKVISYKTNRKVSADLRGDLRGEKISCVEEATALAERVLQNKPHEELWAFALNQQNIILGMCKVASGTVNQIQVDLRNVFSFLLLLNATSLILAHNHPGGSVQASSQDIALTRKIDSLSQPLSIKVLDHIIIASDKTISMAEQNLL